MPEYRGSIKIGDAYIGGKKVSKKYRGNNLFYSLIATTASKSWVVSSFTTFSNYSLQVLGDKLYGTSSDGAHTQFVDTATGQNMVTVKASQGSMSFGITSTGMFAYGDSTITVINSNGSVKCSYSLPEFYTNSSLALAPNGATMVGTQCPSNYQPYMYVFNSSGQQVTQIYGHGVACADDNGNFYTNHTTDTLSYMLSKYDNSGKEVWHVASRSSGPSNMVFAKNRLFVGGSGGLQIYDAANGNFIKQITTYVTESIVVAKDDQNSVYVAGYGSTVYKCDTDGNVIWHLAPGYSYAIGITADKSAVYLSTNSGVIKLIQS